jgi:hypothetical protein
MLIKELKNLEKKERNIMSMILVSIRVEFPVQIEVFLEEKLLVSLVVGILLKFIIF